jgi:hypothetical protein
MSRSIGAATDVGPATLAFVTRVVTGSIETTVTKYDKKLKETVQEVVAVRDPVIVFFPNGTCQVMPAKIADLKGFLEMPKILNFEAVTDADTVAGKFKFALSDAQRKKHWLEMEQAVISRCMRRSGHPLPKNVDVSDHSIVEFGEAA